MPILLEQTDYCEACGVHLVDVISAPVCDAAGRLFCCDDCRRDSENERWESQAYPLGAPADYLD